jgi:hypothetical protein
MQGPLKIWTENFPNLMLKGGFKSEETGWFLHCQNKYSKSLSWAENLNFPPKSVNNFFKFSAQDSDLEYLFWQCKKPPVSSDIKPPLAVHILKFEILQTNKKIKQKCSVFSYRISANSFRGNYSFLNLTYIQVRKLFKGGNYSRAETIRGNTVDMLERLKTM